MDSADEGMDTCSNLAINQSFLYSYSVKQLTPQSQQLLIIFIKNPIIGEVKSRLAKSIGDFNAFKVYVDLLARTHHNMKDLQCDKAVFYSDFVDDHDLWENAKFIKSRQYGEDLGERMLHAIHFSLISGYEKVILIGSDIIDLNGQIILDSFEKLNANDIVIGPTFDGGYYLIGMKKLHSKLFKNIAWSSPEVFDQTIQTCTNEKLSFDTLPKFADLDTFADFTYLSPIDRFRYFQMIKHDNVYGNVKGDRV